jgi:hypothetical protein
VQGAPGQPAANGLGPEIACSLFTLMDRSWLVVRQRFSW